MIDFEHFIRFPLVVFSMELHIDYVANPKIRNLSRRDAFGKVRNILCRYLRETLRPGLSLLAI
jgi:hypothetical protein